MSEETPEAIERVITWCEQVDRKLELLRTSHNDHDERLGALEAEHQRVAGRTTEARQKHDSGPLWRCLVCGTEKPADPHTAELPPPCCQLAMQLEPRRPTTTWGEPLSARAKLAPSCCAFEDCTADPTAELYTDHDGRVPFCAYHLVDAHLAQLSDNDLVQLLGAVRLRSLVELGDVAGDDLGELAATWRAQAGRLRSSTPSRGDAAGTLEGCADELGRLAGVPTI